MNIVSLLSHRNPENHIQAIQFVARSGSPYAIELLRNIAAQSKDMKIKEYCKRAAQEVKKNIISTGKVKKHDLAAHVEILMATAVVALNDLDAILDVKRTVARAYSLDMNLLDNPDYYAVVEKTFQAGLHAADDELRHFVRQYVKNQRVLKSGYPPYMYLIDIPMVIILGGIVVVASNPEFLRRLLRSLSSTRDVVDWEMVQIVGFFAVMLIMGRIFYLIYEQWEKKQVRGWEKEAQRLAIAHLEGEIKKLSTSR